MRQRERQREREREREKAPLRNAMSLVELADLTCIYARFDAVSTSGHVCSAGNVKVSMVCIKVSILRCQWFVLRSMVRIKVSMLRCQWSVLRC